MKPPGMMLVAALCAPTMVLGPAGAEAQATDTEAAAMLLSDDLRRQVQGLRWAQTRPPAEVTPVLRDALITALERNNAAYYGGLRILAQGGHPPAWREETDITPALLEVITSLKDPETIPVLAQSVSSGWIAIGALVNFGEDAAHALTGVVLDAGSHSMQVGSGIFALRMIVEEYGLQHFRPETIEAINSVAAERLANPESVSVLRNAIDLASAMGDPRLLDMLQSIASDPSTVARLGFTDERTVEQIRHQAAARLAGVDPLPRPRR